MNSQQREQLLRRFLDGEMNFHEEQDFYIQVALDDELRLELKAHQTIASAMGKDAVVDPLECAQLETRVALMLASAPYGKSNGGSSASTPSPSASSASAFAGLSTATRWLMIAVVAAAAIVLAAQFIPTRTSTMAPKVNREQSQQTAPTPKQSADGVTQTQQPNNGAATQPIDSDHKRIQSTPREVAVEPRQQSANTEASRRVAPAEEHDLRNDSTIGRVNLELKNKLP